MCVSSTRVHVCTFPFLTNVHTYITDLFTPQVDEGRVTPSFAFTAARSKDCTVFGSKCQTSLLWRVTDAPSAHPRTHTDTRTYTPSLQSVSQPELPVSWGRTNSLYIFGICLSYFSPFLSFSPLIPRSALSNSLIPLSPLPLSVTDILAASRVPDFFFPSFFFFFHPLSYSYSTHLFPLPRTLPSFVPSWWVPRSPPLFSWQLVDRSSNMIKAEHIRYLLAFYFGSPLNASYAGHNMKTKTT